MTVILKVLASSRASATIKASGVSLDDTGGTNQ
jgi:hypothetical protein